MKLNNRTAKKLKKDFPIFRNNPGLIYLDSTATSQKPEQVIDFVRDFYKKGYANIHRGVYRLSENATQLYLKSKKIIADLINAEPQEIVYTRNTTESLNLLAYTISSLIKKGKNEIILTEMEHHSNLIPWQQLAKRNKMKLKFIKIKPDYTLDLKDAEKKITDKTAILSLTHVSNSLGTINPVKEIIKLGKKRGAITIIDAAQSIPHMRVDVKDIGCDFLAFSGHKILGPTGIGVLYGRKELLEKLSPFNFGGEMIKRVTLHNAEWAKIPEKFEAGTPNISGAIGLGMAVKYLQKIGIENIEEWEKTLLRYALSKLKEVEGIKIYNTGPTKSSGIISFNLKKIHPHDVAQLLDEKGIAIRAGHHCNMPLMKKLGISGTCRASFYIYNTLEDIDALVSALKKIKERFE